MSRHRTHARDAAIAQSLVQRSSAVVEDELDAIAQHLSGLVLSDNISMSPSSGGGGGGGLWSRSPLDLEGYQGTRPRAKACLNTYLDSLAVIESLVDDLYSKSLEGVSVLFPIFPPMFKNDYSFPCALYVIEHHQLKREVDSIHHNNTGVSLLKAQLNQKLEDISSALTAAEVAWKSRIRRVCAASSTYVQAPLTDPPVKIDTAHHFQQPFCSVDPILQVALLAVVACNLIIGMSRRGCNFILDMIYYIVQLALMRNGMALSARDRKLLSDFPTDMRTARERFGLDSKNVIFAVCPRCHCTYEPTFTNDSPIPCYPATCSHQLFPTANRCNEHLLRPKLVNGHRIMVPIKTFVYFDFKDWLASLLSRPGIEELMDNICFASDDLMYDIHDGELLRKFQGPHGNPFITTPGHYAFSLSVDFFNPYMNKQAGKKVSIGVISLVCLNLPPDMRYKPENMYLAGIVPGPKEPPLNSLNHYLHPLVSDLLTLWEQGVWFSRTFLYPMGRLILCVLIAVICDLPAARKTAGFAASSHEHFCAICHCTRRREGYGSTDISTWQWRSNNECRAQATSFLNAPDEKTRQAIFDASGVRWSELLRLPYFDPTQFVVVDSMHNLFLGLIKTHFEDILGLREKKSLSNTSPVLDITLTTSVNGYSDKEQASICKAQRMLSMPFNGDLNTLGTKLGRLHRNALQYMCNELHIHPPKSSRKELSASLAIWRSEQNEVLAGHTNMLGNGITDNDLREIRKEIAHVITPSWISSVPSDSLGSSRHGKLKADQWRVLGLLYLPLILVRLWSLPPDGTRDALSQCQLDLLEMTLHLVSAIIIATSEITSQQHASKYLEHMTAYFNAIKRVFPEFRFHPNHHMALHLSEYLKRFGPVQAWWTFPFERLIGMLQRATTNGRIGDLEETISHTFVRSANLRVLLSKSDCPQALKHCEAMFENFARPQMHVGALAAGLSGLLTSDMAPVDDDMPEDSLKSLDRDEYNALHHLLRSSPPRKATFRSTVNLNGLNFSSSTIHTGNSLVIFRSDNQLIPGCIQRIFLQRKSTYIVLRRYLKMPSSFVDPYAPFPALRAGVWRAKMAPIEVIPSTEVVSHFAAYPVIFDGVHTVVVLSLDRVNL